MEGEWDCVVKMMGNTSKGSQTSKYDMNYFLTTEFNGEFGGVPFKGKSTMGYCAARKKYISLWTDSMSPSPMTVEGTYDKETIPSPRLVNQRAWTASWPSINWSTSTRMKTTTP